MSDIEKVLQKFGERALVVSCQPLQGSPMDRDDIVVAMAKAAEIGGASALRIEGVERVRAVKQVVTIPVIGIVKRLEQPQIIITPFPDDITALVEAGADVVAFDATHRERFHSVTDLAAHGRALGVALMADCSSLEDARAAVAAGCDIVGSTLSGYLDGPDKVPAEPDYALIREMAKGGMRVMAEGRIHRPEQLAEAFACGAWAVTVGTALTRLEVTTNWFRDAAKNARVS